MALDKKPDFEEIEKKWQKYWDKNKIYKFNPRSHKPIYSIDTPPLYASASHVHVGHVLNYTQFEIIARYKRMRGFNVYFPPCFDDNGLPTEKYVENKHGIKKSDVTRSKFRSLCKKEAKRVEKDYSERFLKKLGHSYDWGLLYTTIDPEAQKVSQTSFVDLYKKGYAYRASEPTLWCPSCQTALAQATVEEKERDTRLNWIYFELENGKKIEIATTRPEFLPACVAVFVNPKDKRYKKLIGKKAKVPLFDYWVPIKADKSVDIKFGSGVLMVCTFGDTADIEKWRKHGLDLRLCITKDGKLNKNCGKYNGLSLKRGRLAILDDLKGRDYFIRDEKLKQSVGVCWRCGSPIEYLVTKQWFVKTLDFKKQLIKQGRKVKWYPDFYRKRFEDWTENLGWNWCISRQRYYGVPMPIWYCKKCGKEIVSNKKDLPVDPTKHGPNKKCSCGSEDFLAEKDVFDTWMTSSMSPEIAARWLESPGTFDKKFPTNLRPQSHDIIRTWAFYSLLKSHFHFNKTPWKNIMISNYVLDPKGKGMSKSKGNAIWLEDLLEKYSADTIRYWVSTVSLGKDMPFKEKDLVRGSKILIKLWNSARFISMHIKNFNEKPKLNIEDKWIYSRLVETLREYEKVFDSYGISRARRVLEEFFYSEFCDFYLEMIKNRVYGDGGNKKGAQWTLRFCLLEILKMFAPFIPHIAEEIYQTLYKERKSIHSCQFEKNLRVNSEAIKLGKKACEIISEIRQYKQKKNMGMGKQIETYKLKKKPKKWKKIDKLVRKTMRVNQIN